jgi:hypothetical protein
MLGAVLRGGWVVTPQEVAHIVVNLRDQAAVTQHVASGDGVGGIGFEDDITVLREAVPQKACRGAADGLRRAAVVGVVAVGDARDGGEAAARVPTVRRGLRARDVRRGGRSISLVTALIIQIY